MYVYVFANMTVRCPKKFHTFLKHVFCVAFVQPTTVS